MSTDSSQAFVFDAYGTLFDIASLVKEVEGAVPNAHSLIRTWRAKQVEYSLLRTMTNRYRDFPEITRDALDYAIEESGAAVSPEMRSAWVDQWCDLPPYPDVRDALENLSRYPRAILSNGSGSMVKTLVQNANLNEMFDVILTADQVQRFKPDPGIYALAPAALKRPKERILFVTANGFDIAGARAFGFRVCRVDRTGAPADHTGWTPHFTVNDLHGLLAEVQQA